MPSQLKRSTLGCLAVALTIVLSTGACDDSSTAPAGEARVSILLTDAPGDVAEAWVNIGSIYLQGRSCDSGGDSNGDSDGDCGRVWLRTDPTGWIDLTALSDDVEQIVDGVIAPADTYSQLRFVIAEAVIVTEGGSVFATADADMDALNAERGGDPLVPTGSLHCPSCDRSGLKVKLWEGYIVLEGGETVVIADFDVTQSFGRERGNSGRWVMHPLIRASRLPLVGGIEGTVSLAEGVEMPAACGDNEVTLQIFKPIAKDADQESWTGQTSASGEFAIQPLLPGTYELLYELDIDFEDGSLVTFAATANPSSTTVEAGSVAQADYTINSVQCSPGGSS